MFICKESAAPATEVCKHVRDTSSLPSTMIQTPQECLHQWLVTVPQTRALPGRAASSAVTQTGPSGERSQGCAVYDLLFGGSQTDGSSIVTCGVHSLGTRFGAEHPSQRGDADDDVDQFDTWPEQAQVSGVYHGKAQAAI
jgi:hypothetical protein